MSKEFSTILTWHGGEWTPGVNSRLDGDDALSLWTPTLLTLSLYLKQVRMVGQQVLDDHRVLCRVCHINALHLTWRLYMFNTKTLKQMLNLISP